MNPGPGRRWTASPSRAIPPGNPAARIENAGTLIVTDGCTISGNASNNGAGIANELSGTMAIQATTLVNNTAQSFGGGVDNAGTMTIEDGSILQGNWALVKGGGGRNLGTLTIGGASIVAGNQTETILGSTESGGGIANLGTLTVSGSSLFQGNSSFSGGGIWNSAAGSVTIDGSTFANNAAIGVDVAVGGGAVDNEGRLRVLDASVFSGNTTLFRGGVDPEPRDGEDLRQQRGGEHRGRRRRDRRCGLPDRHRRLDLEERLHARRAGGGIRVEASGIATVSGGTVRENTANKGGGIENEGFLTVTGGALVAGNSATTFGGGIENTRLLTVNGSGEVSGNTAHRGGGIDNLGTLTVSGGSAIKSNISETNGGGIDNGLGAAVILSGSIVGLNTAGANGGGIENDGTLTIEGNGVVSINVAAGDGGGVENTGAMIVDGSAFTLNTAAGDGGGISNRPGASATIKGGSTLVQNVSQVGGGIANFSRAVTIFASTIEYNSAEFGGGVLNRDGSITATDVTVASNKADGGQSAGGIVDSSVGSAAIVTLLNCTVAGNGDLSLDDGAGQLYSSIVPGGFADIQLRNTIVAGDGSLPDGLAKNGGRITSMGHNIASDGSLNLDGPSDRMNVDPLLAPLANYGGPADTMAPLPGSPAIDAGDNAGVPATDERGSPRIVDGVVDIGAFESSGFTVSIVGGDSQSTPINAAFSASLVVSVSGGPGQPVAGGTVLFAAPQSGASTSPPFISATIDASGHATASVSANATTGAYTVSAAAVGVATPAAFQLTNLPRRGSPAADPGSTPAAPTETQAADAADGSN